jgi:hypothetical protein
MGLQAPALEGSFAQPKALVPAMAAARDHLAQPFLDQSSEGCAFLPGDPARFPEKAISNMYGCLHMASHIIYPGECQGRIHASSHGNGRFRGGLFLTCPHSSEKGTWRCSIGPCRFFYEVDEEKKIVLKKMVAVIEMPN